MSLYSSYNVLIEYYTADATETFHSTPMKVQAVNDTIQELLEEYPIPEFMKRGTITFDLNGLADPPSDYFRMIKLWDIDSRGVETNEYKYIVEDQFDSFDPTAAYYWTEDYIVANSKRKLKVLPIDSGELQIRYVKTPGTVDSTDSIDSGLNSRWDKVIAFGASRNLLLNAGKYQEAQIMEQEYNKRKAQVYSALKNRGGFKQGLRIKSRYERETLLKRML